MKKCKIHKYQKIPGSAYLNVWSCANPGCTHYMPKHMEHLLEGKLTICWGCGQETILDVDAMECLSENRNGVFEPLCPKCRFTKKTGLTPDLDELAELLTNLEK